MTTKPFVYISSPYSLGDRAVNVHFQLETFDTLMNDGVVWPVAPLWSHFQHLMFPRPYADWLDYDLALLPRMDALLYLPAVFTHPDFTYIQEESKGCIAEISFCKRNHIPVYRNIADLYEWATIWAIQNG